ncbi:MAG: hypothetical protein ACT4OS_07095 [Acidimicrobiales bacterium]
MVENADEGTSGLSADVVAAVGKVTEALEWIERARGRLYDFHQLVGHADATFEAAAVALEECGQQQWAARVRHEVVGRNVLDGRWTFQVIEEFDAGYYAEARNCEEALRDDLTGGERHLFESHLKERRRTRGRLGHESRPP